MGGGSSKTKPPDVVGAAREEGEQARLLAQQETIANRPDQTNFWGSTQWGATPVFDPVTGEMVTQWSQTETLNPEIEAMFSNQLGHIGQAQANPFDMGQFGDPIGLEYNADQIRQRAEDAAYGRATSRLDPQFQQQEQQLLTRLRNQGLAPGDQAYDAAMANFQRGRNDAYEQARMGATGEGRSEAEQMFGQQMSQTELANQLRSQQIGEALEQRGLGTQEMAELMQALGMSGGTPSSA